MKRWPLLPKIRIGGTRTVIITRRYVFKVPGTWKLRNRGTWWRLFLYGLLANMQEREFSKTCWSELCPVNFYIPGGFLVVMPFARPLTFQEWRAFNYRSFVSRGDPDLGNLFDHYARNWTQDEPWQPLHHLERGEAAPGGGLVPALYFRDSFGVFEGRIVAIDYG